jgi:hypothetical protein
MAAWRIVEDGGKLWIEHPGRPPVTVGVEGWRFVLRSADQEVGRFAFLDIRAVARRASEVMRRGHRSSPYTLSLADDAVPHPMVIAGRLLATRQRLLAAVDPEVRAVWARLAPLTREPPQLAYTEALYRDPWIVRDVLQYRAATVALAFVETALRPRDLLWDATTPAGEAGLLEAMRTWRGLFSPTGHPYRTLNRTLMQLAPSVPADLLCGLRHVTLARPYADPLELMALLVARSLYARAERAEVARSHLHVVGLAASGEIVATVARVGQALGRTLSASRPADLRAAFALVADYPQPYHGRLVGLAERALRWHRVAPDLRAEVTALGGVAMPTRRPSVALPSAPEITFLDTVGAVLEEGERMHHCIATYARRAVSGGCYLFHVERGGAQATVEVSRDGTVAQACGPTNQRNVATRWGAKVLADWGLDLMPDPQRRRLCGRAACRRPRAAAPPDNHVDQLQLFGI